MSLHVLLIQRNEEELAAILLVFSEKYHMQMHGISGAYKESMIAA
jgi:hypothetical protein